MILETIGPSIIPALVRHLGDPNDDVRAIVAAALGHLHALETVPRWPRSSKTRATWCGKASSRRWVRLGVPATTPRAQTRGLGRGAACWAERSGGLSGGKSDRIPSPPADPIELAVATLESALGDPCSAVRTQAALALGQFGRAAAAVAPRLIGLLQEADETVRCQAARALGEIGGDDDGATVAALVDLLRDASATVKVSAARALGALSKAAAPSVPALVPLLQDRDEAVRTAAAEAIAQVGPLDQAATNNLSLGLGNRDNVVRAQTAEALGPSARRLRRPRRLWSRRRPTAMTGSAPRPWKHWAKSARRAAAIAVPGLVRALRDRDNWVSALAAEALGQMGDSADGAIPALVRSLSHVNSRSAP